MPDTPLPVAQAIVSPTHNQTTGNDDADLAVLEPQVLQASASDMLAEDVLVEPRISPAKQEVLDLINAWLVESQALNAADASEHTQVLDTLQGLLTDSTLDAAALQKHAVAALQSWKPPPPLDQLYCTLLTSLSNSICENLPKEKLQRTNKYNNPKPVKDQAEANKVFKEFTSEYIPKAFQLSGRGAFECVMAFVKRDGTIVVFESEGLKGYHMLAQTGTVINATLDLVDHRKRVEAMRATHPVHFCELCQHDQTSVLNMILDILIPDRKQVPQYNLSKSQYEPEFRAAHPWWPSKVDFLPVSKLTERKGSNQALLLYEALNAKAAIVWDQVLDLFHQRLSNFIKQDQVLRLLRGAIPPTAARQNRTTGGAGVVPGALGAGTSAQMQPSTDTFMAGTDPAFRLPATFALHKVFDDAGASWPTDGFWVCGDVKIKVLDAFNYIYGHGGWKQFCGGGGASLMLRQRLVAALGGAAEGSAALSAATHLQALLSGCKPVFSQMDDIFAEQRTAIALGAPSSSLAISNYITDEQAMEAIIQAVRPPCQPMQEPNPSTGPAAVLAASAPSSLAAIPAPSEAPLSVEVAASDVPASGEGVACIAGMAGASSQLGTSSRDGAVAAPPAGNVVSLKDLERAFAAIGASKTKQPLSIVKIAGMQTSLHALCNAIVSAGGFRKVFPKLYGSARGGSDELKLRQAVALSVGASQNLVGKFAAALQKSVEKHFPSGIVNFLHENGILPQDMQLEATQSARSNARSTAQSHEALHPRGVVGVASQSSIAASTLIPDAAGKRSGAALSPEEPPRKKMTFEARGMHLHEAQQAAQQGLGPSRLLPYSNASSLTRTATTAAGADALADCLVAQGIVDASVRGGASTEVSSAKEQDELRYLCAKWLCFDNRMGCGENDQECKLASQQECWKRMGGSVSLGSGVDQECRLAKANVEEASRDHGPISIGLAVHGLRNQVDEQLVGLDARLVKEVAHTHIKYLVELAQVEAHYVKQLIDEQAFSDAWDKAVASWRKR